MKKGSFIVSGIIVLAIFGLIFGPISGIRIAQAQDLSITTSERNALEAELRDLEAQVAQKQKELAGQKTYSSSLQGEITRLASQISAKKSEITLKNLRIKQLSGSITEKKKDIQSLSEKIENQKQSLSQLIKKTDEMDNATLTSFLLSSGNLSEFYSDVSRYDKLKSEVKASVDQIQEIRGITENKKTELEKEQSKTLDEKVALEQLQKKIESDKKSQNQLLSISKDKEKEYQKVIADQQAKVSQIKARLFSLAGGGQAIRFDVALQYAREAQTKTGIDPAFLLAIVTQESNLGSNVGQCYLTNSETGEGAGKNTGKIFTNVMKPTRDVPPFLRITGRLGLDPYKTVVSCPIAGVAGWGGAMGPAQFIASTWALFESRLKSALGRDSNPWLPEDAFMASSMYLTDLGAVGSSYSGQIKAACKYYGSGGSTCSYGRSVIGLRDKIQADIDYLDQYGISRR